MKKLVSIIVPCYNQAQYLPEALQSVLEQTYTHWECIIVDDGSQDNTEEVVKKWCARDTRFHYLYQNNSGLSSARNFGIQNSNGNYIVTLDSDDKYETRFIEKALAVILCNDKIGVVSSWGIRFMKDKQYGEFRPTGKSLKDFLFCNAAIGTSLFRKECWENVGGYDENMKSGYEDWEFYLRICKSDWKVHIIEEVLFFYRQHKVSMRTLAINNHDVEIKNYIFLKHKELYKENFEALIANFLEYVEEHKNENLKIRNKVDYRLGSVILKPFRIIKSFFNKLGLV